MRVPRGTGARGGRGIAAVAIALVVALVGSVAGGAFSPRQTALTYADATAAADAGYAWDETVAPNYVVTTGAAEVSSDLAAGQVEYAGLDGLGRTCGVRATVTYQMMADARASGRDPIPDDADPSGWGNNGEVSIACYDGSTYRGYLWNRSHLLADSLGGEATRENLVTGTRMQNVGANDGTGGMAYCETKVRGWLDSNRDGTVSYCVDPVYVGEELVPRAVVVNMRSSDGTIDERVIVFNAAKGYTIDYADGTFSAAS